MGETTKLTTEVVTTPTFSKTEETIIWAVSQGGDGNAGGSVGGGRHEGFSGLGWPDENKAEMVKAIPGMGGL